MHLYTYAVLTGTFVCGLLLEAQEPPRPLISPEVQQDRRVTFRLRAPNAEQVFLALDGSKRAAMQKGEDGVWAITAGPLEPDIYSYSFVADGVTLLDPSNSSITLNLLNPASSVHIPGEGLAWDVTNVPRGVVHHHFYRSNIVGDDRDFYVYTPPGYDPRAKKPYPVLYLLHGFSDDAGTWTSVGRAHVILDNLIAQGKARPMLIVMTLGYGAPEILSRTRPAFRDPGLRQRSFEKFRDSLFEEVMPRVEKEYRTSNDRKMRAIAGLSMGGAESLYIGLNALDRFAFIGAFSSGGLGDDLAAQFPKLDEEANSLLRVFWISCGTEDRLLDFSRKFVEFLKTKKVEVTLREVPGSHNWRVWRRDLANFASMLFQ
ncbi:MAG TPA: alpha/beta hydrolase-fold protein [Bryobacteraceae bacterium]|nr:alpha/beta hydrolase-fold protein [Bryobacteraceae bacterium]